MRDRQVAPLDATNPHKKSFLVFRRKLAQVGRMLIFPAFVRHAT